MVPGLKRRTIMANENQTNRKQTFYVADCRGLLKDIKQILWDILIELKKQSQRTSLN